MKKPSGLKKYCEWKRQTHEERGDKLKMEAINLVVIVSRLIRFPSNYLTMRISLEVSTV